ncbi:MAG: glycosyltransferase family 4 protein [Pirellulales bacterium]|nr:glycosyltransferase family 4 protein [Pirellulales bacterium]
MKIILIADYGYEKGGAERVAWASARELVERGHEVLGFCAAGPVDPTIMPPGESPSGGRFLLECLDQPDLLSGGVSTALGQGLWNRTAARHATALFERLDPAETIVHAHSWTHALSSSPLAAALNARLSLVVTLHDYFLACPNGGFYNFPRQEICTLEPLGWKCLTTNCDARGISHKAFRLLRQMVQQWRGKIPTRLRHFVYLSNLSLDILRPHLPADAQFTQIPNPILVPPGPSSQPAQNAELLFIGRLVPEKAPLLLAQAAANLNLPVTFIGTGPLADEIARIYPAAKLTGQLPTEAVQQRLRMARALVFPSVWYETQGLVVLEAAAQGVPTVVSDACAAREFVADNETGWWFKSGNLEDLQAKLRGLDSGHTVAAAGRLAYDRFWANPPSLKLHGARLESYYQQILQARKDEWASPGEAGEIMNPRNTPIRTPGGEVPEEALFTG